MFFSEKHYLDKNSISCSKCCLSYIKIIKKNSEIVLHSVVSICMYQVFLSNESLFILRICFESLIYRKSRFSAKYKIEEGLSCRRLFYAIIAGNCRTNVFLLVSSKCRVPDILLQVVTSPPAIS